MSVAVHRWQPVLRRAGKVRRGDTRKKEDEVELAGPAGRGRTVGKQASVKQIIKRAVQTNSHAGGRWGLCQMPVSHCKNCPSY